MVDEEVSDVPIKTQIEQHIVVSGVPTRAELEAEILKRYHTAMSRRGFKYHNPVTNIYIYVFGTKEQAGARKGLWIGMVAKGKSDTGTPKIFINEERLLARSSKPEELYGLSEQERIDIFHEIVVAEDKASSDAMAHFPDSQIMKQIKLESELTKKYKADLAIKYDLTEKQLRKIAVEGATKGWPY